jgi:hypothetical protein
MRTPQRGGESADSSSVFHADLEGSELVDGAKAPVFLSCLALP